MVSAHGTDIHRLDASNTAIVLQLKPGEITQRISHRVSTQLLQLLAAKRLRRYHLFVIIACRNNDLVHILDAIESALRI